MNLPKTSAVHIWQGSGVCASLPSFSPWHDGDTTTRTGRNNLAYPSLPVAADGYSRVFATIRDDLSFMQRDPVGKKQQLWLTKSIYTVIVLIIRQLAMLRQGSRVMLRRGLACDKTDNDPARDKPLNLI